MRRFPGSFRWMLPVSLALVTIVGCASTTTLDLRNIDEPVMLNTLPYGDGAWRVKEVGKIAPTSLTDNDYFSWGDRSVSRTIHENPAEVTVYEKIGGHRSRAISGVRIEISGYGLNLLPILSTSRIEIKLFGDIVELDSAPVGGTPSETEASE